MFLARAPLFLGAAGWRWRARPCTPGKPPPARASTPRGRSSSAWGWQGSRGAELGVRLPVDFVLPSLRLLLLLTQGGLVGGVLQGGLLLLGERLQTLDLRFEVFYGLHDEVRRRQTRKSRTRTKHPHTLSQKKNHVGVTNLWGAARYET